MVTRRMGRQGQTYTPESSDEDEDEEDEDSAEEEEEEEEEMVDGLKYRDLASVDLRAMVVELRDRDGKEMKVIVNLVDIIKMTSSTVTLNYRQTTKH